IVPVGPAVLKHGLEPVGRRVVIPGCRRGVARVEHRSLADDVDILVADGGRHPGTVVAISVVGATERVAAVIVRRATEGGVCLDRRGQAGVAHGVARGLAVPERGPVAEWVLVTGPRSGTASP